MAISELGLAPSCVGALGMGAVGSILAIIIGSTVGAQPMIWSLGLRLTGARFKSWWRATARLGVVLTLCATPQWDALRAVALPTTWIGLCAEVAAGVAVSTAALWVWAAAPKRTRGIRPPMGGLVPAILIRLGSIGPELMRRRLGEDVRVPVFAFWTLWPRHAECRRRASPQGSHGVWPGSESGAVESRTDPC